MIVANVRDPGAWSAFCARLEAVIAILMLAPSTMAASINWEGGVTVVYQDANDSRVDAELTASADLIGTLPMERGEWLLYVEGSSSASADGLSALYPTANGDASSLLTSDGDGGIQISELNFTWSLDGGRSLMLGLIDPSAWLDRGRIANDENRQFLNGSFVNNSTIEFPDYTLGGILRMPGNESRPEMTFILGGSDGIADLPDRSYQDLLDVTSEGRGVFAAVGASWLFEHASWRVGTWLRSDDHVVLGNDAEIDVNYGIYGVFGWRAGPHAINLRAGVANREVAIASDFVGLAYQRRIRFGLLGLGAARTTIAEDSQPTRREHGFDSELYLRIPLFGGAAHVTPSIQYIEIPELRVPEPAPASSTTVIGVRFHWSF